MMYDQRLKIAISVVNIKPHHTRVTLLTIKHSDTRPDKASMIINILNQVITL